MLNIRIQTGYSFVKNSLFLLFIVAAIACSNKRRIEETVSEMLHHSIVLPVEDMISLQKDNKRHDALTANYKLIIYVDSTKCSSCFIKHLSVWNEYLQLEEQGKLELVFIIEVPKEELEFYSKEIRYSRFNHLVYFDVNAVFKTKNPHIPKDDPYHVLLIDKSDKIVLVGNPIENPKIEKMLFDIIN